MDPHLFSKVDPDPDPHKVNADPKHCIYIKLDNIHNYKRRLLEESRLEEAPLLNGADTASMTSIQGV
jgi:hypothetical protein